MIIRDREISHSRMPMFPGFLSLNDHHVGAFFAGPPLTRYRACQLDQDPEEDMVANALLAILLGAANDSPQPPACTPQQVVASGKVSELRPESSSLDLDLQAIGLRIITADEVSWTSCSTKLQDRVYGPWVITDAGVAIVPTQQHLISRDYAVPAPDPEPAHPVVQNATFLSSTNLSIGDQRAGLWSRSDGTFLIARYHPGQTHQPTPIFVSKAAVLGLFYLGAPDASGGAFDLWQRLPTNKYRYIHIAWSEQGVR